MKRLARLFSALTIAFLLWAGWLMVSPRLLAPEDGPKPPVLSLPDFRLPEFRLPSFHLPDFLPDIFGRDRGLGPDGRPPTRPGSGAVVPPIAAIQPPITSQVERILIEKAARRMTVWQKDGPERVYQIALGFTPAGDKTRQGDGKTPEGVFKVDRRNTASAFHLSLGIDYPQKSHRQAARAAGLDPGGDIMIHGQPNQVPDGYKVKGDWTAGCIAITNGEIDELFAHVKMGTEVEIRP